MTTLSQTNLARLDASVAVPRYDRADIAAGIVHLGVGGFHRSHEAMYLDALMNQGAGRTWGIHGVGLQPSNVAMRAALEAQDTLYTLVSRHNDGTWEPRVIGALTGYTLAPHDPSDVLDRLADPRVRMVSLTVTEGGYSLDPRTGRFDPSTPDVAADLTLQAPPRTMFGLVTEALRRRRDTGVGAFTVVSCDNIQGNGHVAHDVFISFARLVCPDLAAWIEDEVRFPNSMVDRITPQTTDEDRAELARRFGVEDRWPVVCEPFAQWVLQDAFSAGRPPLEDVGVQLVDDVEPYELMKLRLLNASHQALCYPAYLIGYRLVHDVAADPLFTRYLTDYMIGEAIPTLRPVPGIDLHGYVRELIDRFANPEVRDTVARLCANTSDLIPKFLLPVIRANLAQGRPITRSVAVIACWARYATGVDEQGEQYAIDDNLAAQLRAAAQAERDDRSAFVTSNRTLFGDLADDPHFISLYERLVTSVFDRGVRATLADLDRFDA